MILFVLEDGTNGLDCHMKGGIDFKPPLDLRDSSLITGPRGADHSRAAGQQHRFKMHLQPMAMGSCSSKLQLSEIC